MYVTPVGYTVKEFRLMVSDLYENVFLDVEQRITAFKISHSCNVLKEFMRVHGDGFLIRC